MQSSKETFKMSNNYHMELGYRGISAANDQNMHEKPNTNGHSNQITPKQNKPDLKSICASGGDMNLPIIYKCIFIKT